MQAEVTQNHGQEKMEGRRRKKKEENRGGGFLVQASSGWSERQRIAKNKN